jgi:hypothetical protein
MSAGTCEGCDGHGVRVPALPSCHIRGARRPWIVVERCDTCECFSDDLSAALSLYEVAGWFQCCAGGWHALADSRSRQRGWQDTSRI